MTPAIRVLVVEDNPADARLIEELLAEVPGGGFVVSKVDTLLKGTRAIVHCDVVLLDLSLPDAQGLDSARRMFACAGERPVVILTGNVDDVLATEAVKAGAQDYLVKSDITPSLIAKTLRYAIERKKAEEVARGLVAARVAHGKSEEATRRAEFLAEAGVALGASLDAQTTADRLARLLVPILGDAAFIDLLDTRGDLRRVAQAASDPRLDEVLRSMQPPAAAGPSSSAVAERRTVLVVDPDSARLAHILGYAAELGGVGNDRGSMLSVPMIVRDSAVGVINLVCLAPHRRHSPDDVLLAEDIARRAAMAIDNARLYREAQVAVRARDEVLAVVAHDLRNPLSIFRLVLFSLRRICEDDPNGLELLNKADRAYARMIRLLDDLLDVAQIDAGTLKVQLEPVDLRAVLADAIEFQRSLAADKNVSLDLEVAVDALLARIDRDRFAQLMGNLVSNAVKFTKKGGRILVRAERANAHIRIEVRDTGAGIESDHLENVFDRFWQSGRGKKLGVGLGLAIAKGIVEAHGGTIGVTSAGPGLGSTFSVVVPYSISDER